MSVLMTLEVEGKDSGKRSLDVDGMLESIIQNRCRNLNKDEISKLYKDIEEEAMASVNVYEIYAEKKGKNIKSDPVDFKLRDDKYGK